MKNAIANGIKRQKAKDYADLDAKYQALWRECETLAKENKRLREALEEMTRAIPTNWIDPILTGKDAAIGDYPWSGKDIEKLLQRVKLRLLGIATTAALKKP